MKTIAQEEFDCKGLLDKFANALQTLVTRAGDPQQLADLDAFARTAFLQLGDEALAGVLGHTAAQLHVRGDMPADAPINRGGGSTRAVANSRPEPQHSRCSVRRAGQPAEFGGRSDCASVGRGGKVTA